MTTVDYTGIDSQVWEIKCCNGIVDDIMIEHIPVELQEKIRTVKIADWLTLPEKFRDNFSVVCSGIERGNNDVTMLLKIKFLSCAAICETVKSSCFHIIFLNKVLRIKFDCNTDWRANAREAMLAVDLGNTRTCAVVCPDITSLKMEKLKLESHYSTKSEQTTLGVWDSVCVLGKSEVFKNTSLSFVRVGNDYSVYYRDGYDHNQGMLRTLSTPKRYFWDNDIDREWSITSPGNRYGLDLRHQRDVELARIISEEYNQKFPRAMILEGIIYELLEQAERMLNKHKNYACDDETTVRNWHNECFYQLKHLAVTYPAAWSKFEREYYRKVIQRSVDHFCSQRCGAVPIELHMNCNEATAVLTNFIYSEATRFGSGERWLKLMGKKPEYQDAGDNSQRLCIGVIDIGGGTSDLSIVRVDWDNNANRITTLYTLGTDEAGDMMIAKIIKEFIFDKVLDKLIINGSAERRDKLKNFVVREVLPTAKALARSFWFPLAVQYLIESVKNNSEGNNDVRIVIYDRTKDDAKFNEGFKSLRDKIAEKLENSDDPYMQKSGDFLVSLDRDTGDDVGDEVHNANKGNENIELVFTEDDREKYRKLLRENFRFSPMTFGAAISAYKCDIVVWSGKTSENRDVRRLFENYISVPPSAFISMNEYEINDRDFPLTGLDGKLTDSKYATAIGAALYALLNIRRDQNFPLREGNIQNQNSCYWGTVDFLGNFQPCLSSSKKDGVCKALTYSGTPLLIYRSNSSSPLASVMPSFEFRSKSDKGITDCNVSFKLEQSEDRGLDFELVSGSFRAGKEYPYSYNDPAAKEFFELRLRMVGKEEIWLDTGKIF